MESPNFLNTAWEQKDIKIKNNSQRIDEYDSHGSAYALHVQGPIILQPKPYGLMTNKGMTFRGLKVLSQ